MTTSGSGHRPQGGAGPALPSFEIYGYQAVTAGWGLARELMDPEHETYVPAHNRGGKLGEFGFLHCYNMNEPDSLGGKAYDFPFAEDTSFHGRVERSYAAWLDGLTEVSGLEPDPLLRDATAQTLQYLVFWREREMRRS